MNPRLREKNSEKENYDTSHDPGTQAETKPRPHLQGLALLMA